MTKSPTDVTPEDLQGVLEMYLTMATSGEVDKDSLHTSLDDQGNTVVGLKVQAKPDQAFKPLSEIGTYALERMLGGKLVPEMKQGGDLTSLAVTITVPNTYHALQILASLAQFEHERSNPTSLSDYIQKRTLKGNDEAYKHMMAQYAPHMPRDERIAEWGEVHIGGDEKLGQEPEAHADIDHKALYDHLQKAMRDKPMTAEQLKILDLYKDIPPVRRTVGELDRTIAPTNATNTVSHDGKGLPGNDVSKGNERDR